MLEINKLYCLDSRGHILRPDLIEAESDLAAIRRAEEVMHPFASELWHSGRKVADIKLWQGRAMDEPK
ncbi:hypothetical protein GCM10022280_09520 [Sphingomonas swuensis]|uniref:Uncharacterized protein n=1 Tax=Sphingomonas swuensis TaxID=977800 RepID=A0ABP7SLL9_9SPHN